ncbi:MAG: histidine kinase dimerization/phosphoacceptor domain -containing protein [Syntrophales bacterium]|nr:histidine kinase dimerization/phosphoacceptor domain -containing protein [Syntrophales bacterium]
MNHKKDTNVELTSGNICPVTGLSVFEKPEWTYSTIDGDYRVTAKVIGGNILHTKNSGYATALVIENAVILKKRVANEALAGDYPYVHILDYSDLKGATIDARKDFINSLKNSEQRLKGMIFYGTSWTFNVSISMGNRLHLMPFKVRIVKDYSEAVNLALEILDASKTKRDVSPVSNATLKPLANPGNPLSKIITRDDWSMKTENYSARFEVINGDILHAVSAGVFDETLIEPIDKLREKVITSEIMPHVSYYFIIGIGGVEKASWKARRLYIESLKEWYNKYPFQMIILYGASRMLSAASNLARSFLSFDVRLANTLEDALELIAGEKTNGKKAKPLPARKGTTAEPAGPEQVQQYVDKLLRFMGGIPWDSEGLNPNRERGLSHPLSPVFDALELIKTDMDELLQERKGAEKELRESEDRYRAIFDNTGTATAIIEDDLTIFMANAKFEELSGYSEEELEGRIRWTDFVVEEDLNRMMDYHNKRRGNGKQPPKKYEFHFVDRQGNIKDIFSTVDMIPGTKKSVASLMDITDRKQAEEKIKQSLREKGNLLAEIHHRVKNNMQIISSLLSLQSRHITDKKALSLVKNCDDRIRSMALVHEKLYLSKDLSRVDFSDYLKSMAIRLFQTYEVDSRVVTFLSSVKDALFTIETAIPLGLIINELLSNALRYAFPGGRKGEIAIALRKNKKTEETTLTFADDGIGFPEGIDYQNPESFGLQLVNMLTEQLGGTMEFDGSRGTSFRITFKEQIYKGRR